MAEFDILYMAQHLRTRLENRHGTILVLGSRAGSLFRSTYLYETLKQYADPSFQDLPQIKQFAQCYHLLNRKKDRQESAYFSAGDIDAILSRSMREVELLDADICLAELAKRGLFDIIVTTNMDNLLESSFEYIGMKELQDFEIFSMRDGARERQFRLKRQVPCQIVKVFGQVTAREYTVRRGGFLQHNQEVRAFLEEKLASDVLIMGLDPVWDAELYQAFPAEGGSLWFINEDVPDESSPFAQKGEVRTAAYFVGVKGNYEYFVQELYEAFLRKMPVTSLLDYHMNGSILRALHQFRSEFRNELRSAQEFRSEVRSELQKLRAPSS